jgi:hypothetical protein
MAKRKRTGLVQVKLRITDDLKRRLDKEASKRVDGSLSAEIAERLERSFTAPALEEAVATSVVDRLKKVEWGPGQSAGQLERLANYKMTPADMEPQPISGGLPQLPFEAGSDEDQQRPEKHGDRTDVETER